MCVCVCVCVCVFMNSLFIYNVYIYIKSGHTLPYGSMTYLIGQDEVDFFSFYRLEFKSQTNILWSL